MTARPNRLCRWVAAGAVAAGLTGALPAVAGAADYCVVPNVGCGGTNVVDLQTALEKAKTNTDADRIFLGAWTYTAPTTGGFDYSQSNSPVEIIGKGPGQTVLTGPSAATGVLRLFGGAGSSVHDLRIQIPASAAYGFNGLATDDAARRIDVVEASPQQTKRTGVHLENGGTLEDSSVMLSGAPQTTAVWLDAGGGTVRNSTMVAYVGVASAHGGTIERSRFSASAALVGAGNVTTVKNSVMHIGALNSVGLYASPQPGRPATINADGLTIVGLGRNSSQAVVASTFSAPDQNAHVNLKNSIIRGGRLTATAKGGGQARIAVSYTDIESGPNQIDGVNAGINLTNMLDLGDARFVDPQFGDYHLRSDSPLIDVGDPSAAQGADMDGHPSLVDGNGDGTPRRDLGAFEFQTGAAGGGDPPPAGGAGSGPAADTQAPLIGRFRATPSLFALAQGTRFRYSLSEPARVTLKLQRALPGRRAGGRCVAPSPRLRQAKRCTRYVGVGTLRRSAANGANSIRFSGRIGKRALRPGRYRAVITATDAAGNRSPLRKASFRIAAS